MELEFRKDFEDVKRSWTGFWSDRNTRPMLYAVVPKEGVEPISKPGYALCSRDDNHDALVDQLLGWAGTHEFLGDAIPFYYLEFSADHFSALLGADLRFENGQPGGWAVPFVEDIENTDIRFRPESRWWEKTVRAAKAIRERCDGKVMIAAPTLVANVDALCAICGAEKLLMDLVENPEAVHGALDQITTARSDILEAFSELFDFDTFGSINRHGVYCDGRINVPQCDFSCMISPEMFDEFVRPCLRREIDELDASEYHLDGPDAIKHLESICSIENLDLIQWVPGAGQAGDTDWSFLFEKIDSLGKGYVRGADCETAVGLWREARTRKMFLMLAAESRKDIESCIQSLESVGK